jgi:hypothetical protein
MTFEERIDRLTERHEALTQTVELIVHSQRDAEKRHNEAIQKIEEVQAKTQVMIVQMVESIDSLARVAPPP